MNLVKTSIFLAGILAFTSCETEEASSEILENEVIHEDSAKVSNSRIFNDPSFEEFTFASEIIDNEIHYSVTTPPNFDRRQYSYNFSTNLNASRIGNKIIINGINKNIIGERVVSRTFNDDGSVTRTYKVTRRRINPGTENINTYELNLKLRLSNKGTFRSTARGRNGYTVFSEPITFTNN